LISLVQSGIALAVVPRLALPRETTSVVGVLLKQPTITRTIGLIQRRGRSLSPAAAMFSTLVKDAVRND